MIPDNNKEELFGWLALIGFFVLFILTTLFAWLGEIDRTEKVRDAKKICHDGSTRCALGVHHD